MEFLIDNISSTAVDSVILLIVILLFMIYIVKEPKGAKPITKPEEKK